MPHTHSPYILVSANVSCVQVSHREAMALIHAVDQRGELQVCANTDTHADNLGNRTISLTPLSDRTLTRLHTHKCQESSQKRRRKAASHFWIALPHRLPHTSCPISYFETPQSLSDGFVRLAFPPSSPCGRSCATGARCRR